MDTLYVLLVSVAAALVLVTLIQRFWPRPTTVMEHEKALRYKRGHLIGVVGPGRHWLRPGVDELRSFDMRRRQMVVAGQEVLTSDRVPVKISLVAVFSIDDLTRAVTEVVNFEVALYTQIQLAVREAVAGLDLEAALAERGELGSAVHGAVVEPATELGLTLHSTQVRDYMMGGGLRQSFVDVVQARQEGVAALERARGESAAIRNLANAAQLMERHPGLMHLRLIQAVHESSGNRIVISLDPERAASTAVDVATGEP